MSVTQLRPLGIGEILDVGITIYRRNFRALLTLVFVVVAPFEVLSALIQASALPDNSFLTDTSATEPVDIDRDFWLGVSGFGAAALLSFIAGLVATGACFKAIADGYLGERADWRPALAYAARRFHSILWVTILGTLIAVIGFIFLFVPGVYLYVCFAVAVPVLLTEGVKGRKALGRSRRLVRGRWWGTLGVVFLGALLVGIVEGALVGLTAIVTTVDTVDPTLSSFIFSTIATVLASVISTPLSAAFITVLYFDLRVRKEAFDLQLLAEQIGVAPGEGVSPAARAWTETPLREELDPDDQPPYWPPPPGWKPRSQREAEQREPQQEAE
jgi:hypothetical protein